MSLDRFFVTTKEEKKGESPWDVKYAPEQYKDVNCNKAAAAEILSWCKTANTKPKQVLCVVGPNGCGKTHAVHLCLKETNKIAVWKDLNEQRNKALIDELKLSCSVSSENKVIVIDNADINTKGIVDFIKETYGESSKNHHVGFVLIGNNTYGSLKTLFAMTKTVTMQRVSPAALTRIGKIACKKEGHTWSDEKFGQIVKRCVGDVRYLLLQLQFACASNGAFSAVKRLEHKSVFDACEEMLNGNVGVHKGSYLISLDTGVIPCMMFENVHEKLLPHERNKAFDIADVFSCMDILDNCKSFGMSDIVELLPCAVNFKVRTSKRRVTSLRYPCMFSKIHVTNTRKKTYIHLRTHLYSTLGYTFEIQSFAKHMMDMIREERYDDIKDTVVSYKLTLPLINDLMKLNPTQKLTLKTKMSRFVTSHSST